MHEDDNLSAGEGAEAVVTEEVRDECGETQNESAAIIDELTKERDGAVRAYEESVLKSCGVKDGCAADVLLLAKAAGGGFEAAVRDVLGRYPWFRGEEMRLTISLPATVEEANNDSALRQAFGL